MSYPEVMKHRDRCRTNAPRPFRVGLAVVVLALLSVGPRPSWAKPERQGDILFGRGEALWAMPADNSSEPIRVASLGRPAADIERMTVSTAGDVVLVDFADGHAVLVLEPGTVATPKSIDCAGKPALSGDGRCVLCPAGAEHGAKVWLYILEKSPAPDAAFSARPKTEGADGIRQVLKWLGPDPVAFIGSGPPAVAVTGARGLWRVSISPFRRRLVAPHTPDAHLLIAPNGERAVGSYEMNGRNELVGFRLDGEAARRKLITEGVPIAWSRDSRWLMVQHGRRACVVRAVGGEYKCWRRFRGIGIAADGAFALLGRHDNGDADAPMRLYIGELAGARPTRPRLLIEGVTGPATWLPSTEKPKAPALEAPAPAP